MTDRTESGSTVVILRALGALAATDHVVNQYSPQPPCCPDPTLEDEGASARLARLSQHLEATAASPLALIGEAAGWRGARQSGIAFTAPGNVRAGATQEASATVVQSSLAAHRLAEPARLWNAYPLHPHRAGQPRTNRAPTRLELTEARPLVAAAVGERLVIAVGRNAARSWSIALGTNVPTIGTAGQSAVAVAVRHPSFGGAATFRVEIAAALAHFGLIDSAERS